MVAAAKAFQGPLGPVATLGAHTACTVQTRPGPPRFSLMRSGFVGFRPLHLVPLSSSPPYTLSFSCFVSCLSVFMSWHLILSLFCVHLGPALSVCVHSHFNPRSYLGRPGFYKEVGFIGCPWSLGFFSLQPHTNGLSCPPFMSSSVCLFRAHTCTPVLTLVPPRLPLVGGVYVKSLESQGIL